MSNKIVTRFAPSPTGQFHLGGVRSALYNYLFAKQNKGTYILRSEDTDKERSKKEYEDGFLELFEWLGLKAKDNIHRLVAGKYLKQLLALHQQAGTLDITKDQLEQKLCCNCLLPEVCKRWNKVGKLTCFCLESVF